MLDPLPGRAVVPGKLLKAERALETWCDVERHQRGFDRDRPAAAQRIEKRRPRLPGREPQQSRREVFAQRRLGGLAPIASLEQRLTGGIEVERRLVRGEIGVHPDVRILLAHARALSGDGAVTIADRVLDLERREFQARQR